jgi:hypothetical protein
MDLLGVTSPRARSVCRLRRHVADLLLFSSSPLISGRRYIRKKGRPHLVVAKPRGRGRLMGEEHALKKKTRERKN